MYKEEFKKRAIEGPDLLDLTAEDLPDLKITDKFHVKKILRFIQSNKESVAEVTTSTKPTSPPPSSPPPEPKTIPTSPPTSPPAKTSQPSHPTQPGFAHPTNPYGGMPGMGMPMQGGMFNPMGGGMFGGMPGFGAPMPGQGGFPQQRNPFDPFG